MMIKANLGIFLTACSTFKDCDVRRVVNQWGTQAEWLVGEPQITWPKCSIDIDLDKVLLSIVLQFQNSISLFGAVG